MNRTKYPSIQRLFGLLVLIGLAAPLLASLTGPSRGYIQVEVEKPPGFRETFTVTVRSLESKRTYEAGSWTDLNFRLKAGDYEVNVAGIDGVLLPFASQLAGNGQDDTNSGQAAPVARVQVGQTSISKLDLTGQLAPHRAMQVRLLLGGTWYHDARFRLGAGEAWQIGKDLPDGSIQYLLFQARQYTHLDYDGGIYAVQVPAEGDTWVVDVPTGSLRVQLPKSLKVPGRTRITTDLTRTAENGAEGGKASFTHWIQLPEETPKSNAATDIPGQEKTPSLFEWDPTENSLTIRGVQPGSYKLKAKVVHQTIALGGRFLRKEEKPPRPSVSQEDLHAELWVGEGQTQVEVGRTSKWAAE